MAAGPGPEKKIPWECIVPVLPGVHQGLPEIPVAAPDDGREPNDFRPGSDDGHEMQGSHGLHLLGIGIGMVGIKAGAGPKDGHQIGATPVFYGVA